MSQVMWPKNVPKPDSAKDQAYNQDVARKAIEYIHRRAIEPLDQWPPERHGPIREAQQRQAEMIVEALKKENQPDLARIVEDFAKNPKNKDAALKAIESAPATPSAAPSPSSVAPATPSRSTPASLAAMFLAAAGASGAAVQQQNAEADAPRIAAQGASAAAAALAERIRSGQGNFGGGPAIDTTAPRPSTPVASAALPPESSAPDPAAILAANEEVRRRMAVMAALGIGGQDRVQAQAPITDATAQAPTLGQQARRLAMLEMIAQGQPGRQAPVKVPPKGELPQTFQVVAAAQAAPTPQTPSVTVPATAKSLESMGVLGNKDKSLTENYDAAVKAMRAIRELDATQAATVIQSFKDKQPKFAQALQDLHSGKVSFLKTGDVLHNARQEYQSAEPAQRDPRAATAAGDFADAGGLLAEQRRRLPQILAQVEGQLRPHVTPAPQAGRITNMGELFADPKVQEAVQALLLRIANESGIKDPSKIPPAMQVELGRQIGEYIQQNTSRVEKILKTQGQDAAIAEYMKVNEEAARKAIQSMKPDGKRLEPTSMDDTSYAPQKVAAVSTPAVSHLGNQGAQPATTFKI